MIRGAGTLISSIVDRNLTKTRTIGGGSSNGAQRSAPRGGGRGSSWGGRGGSHAAGAAKVAYASSAAGSLVSSATPHAQVTQPRGGSKGHSNRKGPGGSSGHRVQLPDPSSCPRLVDIGANLSHRDFKADLPELLQRAQTRNVCPILVTGTSLRASEEALTLCSAHPGFLYSTAGVHPHDAKSCDDKTIGKLRALATNPTVVAIGECGLDFDRNFSEPAVQEFWFAEQLKLAAECKKPVFLHERGAHTKFVEILQKNREILDLSTCVVHCFTGTAAELKTYLEMGMYIGITGWVTNKEKGADLRDAVKLIPLDRIMIETDAPFLAPRNGVTETGARAKVHRNEPELLHLVLSELAQLMGVSEKELAEASTANAHRFFNIPLPTTQDQATPSKSEDK